VRACTCVGVCGSENVCVCVSVFVCVTECGCDSGVSAIVSH